jgi:hypothetical protein
MNPFKSEKIIPISVPDLAPVAQELQAHFEQRRYQVECQLVQPGVWEVGVTRGGMFKAAMGLKSSMKVQLKGVDGGTMVQARVGIFGKQAIPTMVTMLVLWQMIFLQAWTLIRESALDDEAVRVVQISLTRHQRAAGADRAGADRAGPAEEAGDVRPPARAADPRHCTGCGTGLDESARFCPQCGQTKVA